MMNEGKCTQCFYIFVKCYCSTENDIVTQIIKPLKEVRKISQNPAHRIYDNTYDMSVYKL
jgi:hypothetical protein